MSEIKLIEDKIVELTNDFNTKSDNVNKLTADIAKYSQAKEMIQNEMHAISGAIQAYKATVDLLKGKTNPEPQIIEGSATPSG